MQHSNIHLVECPRDAMQGWKTFIPTEIKIAYINALLRVGFHTIDFGSFVSPQAIPQLADTHKVIQGLDSGHTQTKLLAIVANVRGAQAAVAYEAISCLGYPFSISETFQQRNANSSVDASLQRLAGIQELCISKSKRLVVYISMGFGNPYGDPYSEDIVYHWVNKLSGMGITMISLADTVGIATASQVSSITGSLVQSLPQVEIGVHLHSTPANWKAKVEAALSAGCRRFDGALKGIGGCPMAGNELIGNINTVSMIDYFRELHMMDALHGAALQKSLRLADEIFQV